MMTSPRHPQALHGDGNRHRERDAVARRAAHALRLAASGPRRGVILPPMFCLLCEESRIKYTRGAMVV